MPPHAYHYNKLPSPFIVEVNLEDYHVSGRTSILQKLCNTCKKCNAKYKCAQCFTWNCSLDCVNRHKVEVNCDGRKTPKVKIAIKDFDDNVLRQDLRFLEKVSHLAERASRITARRLSASLQQGSLTRSRKRTVPVAVLRKKCEERNIHLHVFPFELSRRQENTTQITRKAKRLAWRVDWRFPEHRHLAYVDPVVSEDSSLESLLERFVVGPVENSAVNRQMHHVWAQLEHVFSTLKNADNPCEVDDYEILLKDYNVHKMKDDTQPQEKRKCRWFILNKKKTLGEALRHKHIVEYPEFHIASTKYCHEIGTAACMEFVRDE